MPSDTFSEVYIQINGATACICVLAHGALSETIIHKNWLRMLPYSPTASGKTVGKHGWWRFQATLKHQQFLFLPQLYLKQLFGIVPMYTVCVFACLYEEAGKYRKPESSGSRSSSIDECC